MPAAVRLRKGYSAEGLRALAARNVAPSAYRSSLRQRLSLPFCCSTAPVGIRPPTSTRPDLIALAGSGTDPAENASQYLRGNWLSNLVFDT